MEDQSAGESLLPVSLVISRALNAGSIAVLSAVFGVCQRCLGSGPFASLMGACPAHMRNSFRYKTVSKVLQNGIETVTNVSF